MANQTSNTVKGTYPEKPEISIWIDKYDDVFSEFDSRPFNERSFSDDFLTEVRKITSEKSGNVRLKFHIFDNQRNSESEDIIVKNLKGYFQNIAEALKSNQRQIMHKGYMLSGFGFVLISFIFFLTTLSAEMTYLHGIILLLEPVGWFLTWTGLDQIFQVARKEKPAIDFNSRMAQAEMIFSSFEVPQTASGSAAEPKQKTVIPLDSYNLRVA